MRTPSQLWVAQIVVHVEHEPLESRSIITTEANDLMKPLHDRMPVTLYPVDYDI
jgi:putative SOS response-associated peptidase YedK